MEKMLDCCCDYSTTDAQTIPDLRMHENLIRNVLVARQNTSKSDLVEKSLINMLEFKKENVLGKRVQNFDVIREGIHGVHGNGDLNKADKDSTVTDPESRELMALKQGSVVNTFWLE